MKTAIMTDTNSGITKNIAEKLGIYVIHMPIIIDETTFYENDTITEAEFSMRFPAANTLPLLNPPLVM